MPYRITTLKHGEKRFLLVKKTTGKVVSRHKTKKKAEAAKRIREAAHKKG